MPKEYFSIANVTPLASLPAGGRIHIVGVSGVAMAQLAVSLAARGYKVSGSDKEFYEPMGSYLAASPVEVFHGYSESNIPSGVQLVIIGNAVSYGHPEVELVEQRRLPYSFFPKVLYELIIAGKRSVVVSGTHGKTTTSALCAALLTWTNSDPAYFIGGVAKDLSESLHDGRGKICVVEGDEYDSAFFAKTPKFNFYKPNSLLITSIEFDHADIYASLQDINREFFNLVLGLKAEDQVACCIDSLNVFNQLSLWKQKAKCNFITYGEREGSDLRLVDYQFKSGQYVATVETNRNLQNIAESRFELVLTIPGMHNAKNALGAILALGAVGQSISQTLPLLAKFQGVKRRQDVRLANDRLILIEDFAHHPTAVRETIRAIKVRYPDRNIWAVFEPRSNTSRRKIFQQEYIGAFEGASRVLLCSVIERSIDKGNELIDLADLARSIGQSGIPTQVLADAQAIAHCLSAEVKKGDVVLVMSNGSFGGLIEILKTIFEKSH